MPAFDKNPLWHKRFKSVRQYKSAADLRFFTKFSAMRSEIHVIVYYRNHFARVYRETIFVVVRDDTWRRERGEEL